jgi:NAD(P)H-hydrate epimerase
MIIGGCSDYIGAPSLTARATYRVGGGLVAYAVPQTIKHIVASLCPEATFVPLPESQDMHAPSSLAHVERWLSNAKDAVVAVGMGMGQADPSAAFLRALLAMLHTGRLDVCGVLCDADALNMLAKLPDWHAQLPPLTVLTPHAGEMARLAGATVAEIQGDRIGNALKYAKMWSHVVVLKGAHTVIAAPDQRAVVMPFSNPAMATAGTGDVLAGCIVGLMAQGLSPFDAAACGAYVHGEAGERWRAQHGDAGMLASDLLLLLTDVIHDLKK